MSCCKDQTALRTAMTQEVKSTLPVVKLKCQNNCERCRKEKENKAGNKKGLALLASLLIVVAASAQSENDAPSFFSDPFNDPMTPFYAVMALVFVTVTLTLLVMVYMLRVLRLFIQQSERDRAKKAGLQYVPAPSWWQTTWDKWNAAVPLAQEQDIDLGHDFDGIRELDNHLPPWWKGLFYLTILFSVIYLAVYHVSNTMPLSVDEYQHEQEVAAERARLYRASQPAAVIDVESLVYAPDEAILAKGKSVFLGSCVPCHRKDGGGNTIGPNLTDQYWLHGGGIKDVYRTIQNGFVDKGMPAWGKTMSASDVRDVAFYIMSLQGSNPENPKAPQGELYKADSTLVVNSARPVQQ